MFFFFKLKYLEIYIFSSKVENDPMYILINVKCP